MNNTASTSADEGEPLIETASCRLLRAINVYGMLLTITFEPMSFPPIYVHADFVSIQVIQETYMEYVGIFNHCWRLQ